MQWKRPDSIPVGQVWSRFTGRELNGEPPKNYQIRDMDEKWKERCLDLMEETYLKDEPICAVLGVIQDPDAIAAFRIYWEKCFSQSMCLACFTEVDGEPDELVGFNLTLVKSPDDEEPDYDLVKSEPLLKLLRVVLTAEKLVDVFQLFKVDKYMTSAGLTVLPQHRGQNIGAKFFKARQPLCKAMGINATATLFTAKASQVLAAKCGYEVLAELSYKEVVKFDIDLSNCTTTSAKIMGTKYSSGSN